MPEAQKKWLGWLLFAMALLAWSYFLHWHDRWPNPNETARLYSTLAMVEDHTFAINRQIDANGVIWDRAERGGKLYSDKAPGLSFLAVLPIAIAEMAAEMAGRRLPYMAKQWIARFFTMVLPAAFLVMLMFGYLRKFLPDPWLRAGLMWIYVNGTCAATYSSLLFGHQLSAVLLFCAYVLLERAGERGSTADAMAAGLLAGFSVITEYPTAPAAAIVFIAVFFRSPHRWRLLGAATALIPAALALWYNKACFGSYLSLGYQHLDSATFAKVHSQGFLGVTLPSAAAFLGTFIGPQRGLLFFSPVCIFGFAGLVSLWRDGWKRLSVMILAMIAAFTYITSSFGYWIGGDCVGPRHLTPLIPFLFIPIASWVKRANEVFSGPEKFAGGFGRAAWLYTLFVASAFISVIMTTASSIPFPFFPTPMLNPFRDLALWMWGRGVFPYNAGMLLGLRGIYSAVPFFMAFLVFAGAAFLWLVRPIRGFALWRSGLAARGILVVAIWISVVVNILPGDVTEGNMSFREYILSLYDPAGQTLADIEAGRAGGEGSGELAAIRAAAGRTADALSMHGKGR